MFEISQIAAPAGAAKIIALHKTINVLSINDVYMVFQNLGGRYGGNSKLKVETSPFKTVLDKPQETKNIKAIPRTAIPTTDNNEATPEKACGTAAPTKIVAIRIWVGQRPLQSEKLLVIIWYHEQRRYVVLD